MIAAPPDLRVDRLVALDPGTRNVGLALFELGPGGAAPWVLRSAIDFESDGTVVGAVSDIVRALGPWRVGGGGVALVAEYPRQYRDRREAHDDIAALQTVVDRLMAAPWAYPWSQTARVRPSAWKGQTPKTIAHERYRRALTPSEQEHWPAMGPDAKDAVGIGLWATGRYPGRTLATAAGNRRWV